MSVRMDRIQFYLEPELNAELNRMAHELKVTKAELIRQGIRHLLKEKGVTSEDPARNLIGFFKIDKPTAPTNWVRNHDEIIYRRNGEV